MRIASFDCGVRNLAWTVYDYSQEDLRRLTRENVHTSGRRIVWELVDFGSPSSEDFDVLAAMTLYLDSHRKLLDGCVGFLIEQQLKINIQAQFVEKFLYSYFKINYGTFKYVHIIKATRKTQIFATGPEAKESDASSTYQVTPADHKAVTFKRRATRFRRKKRETMAPRERKKWAGDLVFKHLIDSKDNEGIRILTSAKKQDDLADAVLQMRAFLVLVFIDKKLP